MAAEPAPGAGAAAASSSQQSFLQTARRTISSLPAEVWLVLTIDFFNSYRSFGLSTVQYQYVVNEFGYTDLETGSLLGVQAWLLTHNTRKPS